MIGGIVNDIIHGEALTWIQVRGTGSESKDRCSILVETDHFTALVREGDSIWWQGDHALWTTPDSRFVDHKFMRRGFSGVNRPHLDHLRSGLKFEREAKP